VQRIKDFNQRFRRFVAGKILGLLAIFFAAISVHAGEPIMALPMLDYSQPSGHKFAAGLDLNDPFAIVSPPSNTSVEEMNWDAPGLKIENEFSAPLERPAIRRRDPLMFVHENLRAARSFEVCVGYERLWEDSTILPKISGRSDTGCAGVKASFSF
jgi:hypothetical protein